MKRRIEDIGISEKEIAEKRRTEKRIIGKGIMNKEFSGMITVEMAYIVPVILFVFFLSVMGIFYYHDKAVISACAYEAAVAGSVKARERDGVTDGIVSAIFEERVHGKCILFGYIQGSAQISEERIVVRASASKGRMQVSVTETASITEPEVKIRRYRELMP